ncbi:MAG: HipA domain-containing protein [Candidatus Acidiferrales bacterium]
MEEHVYVYVDLEGKPVLAGELWTRTRRAGDENASFSYDQTWLKNPARFSLEPALLLTSGAHHTPAGRALFGAIGDSAPDRWGRTLMARAERRAAETEKRSRRSLREVDYLLHVDDLARQGALRFANTMGGPFLARAEPHKIPSIVKLPELLAAAEHLEDDKETAEEFQLLLAPGSSLGGARPKASVEDRQGRLAIAKFPSRNDTISTTRWEAVALTLAEKAGVPVSEWRIESVANKPVLLLVRFDRRAKIRIPFLSGMSMLTANDNEEHSYLELADAIRQHGAAPVDDLRQLWRRMVLNILISNTDDHLRNHGFLYAGNNGWRLSPAYDLNPVAGPRVLSLSIDFSDRTASLDSALAVSDHFGIGTKEARKIAVEVGKAVSGWRSVAKKQRITAGEIEDMSPAFEHDDLRKALTSA